MKKATGNRVITKVESLKDQLLRARESVVIEKLRREGQYEFVQEFNGKLFINDCNSIDLNACMAAIDEQKGNVIWICYAPPTNRELRSMENLIKSKVKALFCLGEASGMFLETFGDHIELFLKIENVEEGLLFAEKYGAKGDVVLFSPGSPNYRFFETDLDWNEEFTSALNSLRNQS